MAFAYVEVIPYHFQATQKFSLATYSDAIAKGTYTLSFCELYLR